MKSPFDFLTERPFRYIFMATLLLTTIMVLTFTILKFPELNTSPTPTSPTLTIITVLVAIFTVITMGFTLFRITSATDRISTEVKYVRKSLTESKSATTEAIDQKKEQFINIPNISFHFASKDEIINFYNDYFKEPTIEEIVSEITGEITGEAKAKIPQVLESKIGGKDVSKWISTIKIPDVSVPEMFRRYQRETIRNGQVTLGLELVDIDLSDLGAFEKIISTLKSNFDFQLDEPQIEKQRTILKKKAAEKTILRLENTTGWVLIEGKFTISELPNGFYQCVYEHPVSEYLVSEGKQITVSIILRKESIEPNIAGNYAQSIGRAIPLKVYGKVWQPVDRKGNVWELQISPLAVY